MAAAGALPGPGKAGAIPREKSGSLVQGLGPVAATALVAGNIIASGIYVVPGSLAEKTGPLSLLAWVINALGYLALTAVFADLGGAVPLSGGPQVFARRAFGEFAGVAVSYLYWISCVTSLAAFVTGFVGYLAVFFPVAAGALAAFLVAQTLLWSLTLVNVLGVRAGGGVQIVTTVLKIVPLLVLGAALLPQASTANLVPFAPHGPGSLLPAIALVSWLFLGSESVTVPAEEVRGLGGTIRRSAYAGFALAAGVYMLVAVTLSLGLPPAAIAGSSSPLAAAARGVLGVWGERLVTLGALVSILGALNGWILVTGRLPFAAAREGYAPALFGRIHPRFGTPDFSLVVSSLLAGGLVVLYFTRTLLEAYNVIAIASTAAALVAIGAACLAEMVLLRREPGLFTRSQRLRGPWTAVAGFLVVILMILGAIVETPSIAWLTPLVMIFPVSYYFWLRFWRRAAMRPSGE